MKDETMRKLTFFFFVFVTVVIVLFRFGFFMMNVVLASFTVCYDCTIVRLYVYY